MKFLFGYILIVWMAAFLNIPGMLVLLLAFLIAGPVGIATVMGVVLFVPFLILPKKSS